MEKIDGIIEKIQKGKGEKELLYKELTDFINIQKKINFKYVRSGFCEMGDLLSLIWLGIEDAAATYDKGRDCKFLTWASSCIRICLLNEAKKRDFRAVSLDTLIGQDEEIAIIDMICDPSAYEAFSVAESQNDDKMLLDEIEALPVLEKQVITLCCLKNLSPAKAAEQMSISVKQLQRLKIKGLTRLKEFLL